MCVQSPGGYTFTCMCAHVESRGKPSVPPWTPFVYLDFWTVSHFLLDLTGLAGWLGSEPQESQLPPPQCWGHKHTSPQLVFWGLGFASCFPPALPRLSSQAPPPPPTLCFLAFPNASASLLFPPLVGLGWMTQSEKPEPRPLLWPLAGLLTCKYFPPGLAAFHPSCDLLGLLFTCPSRKLSVLFATN